MPQPEQDRKKLKAAALAQHLDCGKSTIYRMVKEGQIPSIPIGKTGLRFDLDEVLSALKK
jgi:excisionase family DNA binding protein